METLKNQFRETVISKTKEFHKYTMDSLVSAGSGFNAYHKANLISYTICSQVIGCNKNEFFEATGIRLYNNKKKLTALDNLIVKEYSRILKEKIKQLELYD